MPPAATCWRSTSCPVLVRTVSCRKRLIRITVSSMASSSSAWLKPLSCEGAVPVSRSLCRYKNFFSLTLKVLIDFQGLYLLLSFAHGNHAKDPVDYDIF